MATALDGGSAMFHVNGRRAFVPRCNEAPNSEAKVAAGGIMSAIPEGGLELDPCPCIHAALPAQAFCFTGPVKKVFVFCKYKKKKVCYSLNMKDPGGQPPTPPWRYAAKPSEKTLRS